MNIITQYDDGEREEEVPVETKPNTHHLALTSGSASEIVVRSHIRKKPKIKHSPPVGSNTPRRKPKMDIDTVKLINSMFEEDIKKQKEKNKDNPNEEIMKASEAWQGLFAQKKKRRRPLYRSAAKARKRLKIIEKKKENLRRLRKDYHNPICHLLDDPDLWVPRDELERLHDCAYPEPERKKYS